MIKMNGRTGLEGTMTSGSNVCSELTRVAAFQEIEVTCFNNASQMNCDAVLRLQDNR